MQNDTKPLEAYLDTLGIGKWFNTLNFNVPLLGYKLSPDVKNNSYWNVDTSSWHDDVMQEFDNGNIILNHAIHDDVSIIMRKSQFEKYVQHPDNKIFKDFNEWWATEKKIEEEYYKRSDAIEASKVLKPGYIFYTSVADGNAIYIVTKLTKASVFFEHLHFGDGYRDQTIESFQGKLSLKQFMLITRFGSRPVLARLAPIF
jgi:hypothetical protein